MKPTVSLNHLEPQSMLPGPVFGASPLPNPEFSVGMVAAEPERTSGAAVVLPEVPTTRVWGLDFALFHMADVVDRAERVITSGRNAYFITANLNYSMLTANVPELAEVNQQADLVIADGYPIVLRSWFNRKRLPGRVAGSDLIIELARLSAAKGYRIYFLGGAPGVAQKAADNLQAQFPDLQVAGCAAPPFRTLSPEEQTQLFSEIRRSEADILLVAFGQPKGELWIHRHHQELGVPLSIQLGASFDFLAGTARRAPRFWQLIGCEWLYRTLHEPRRLAPRYLGNIAFLLKAIWRDLTGLKNAV